MKKFRSRTFMLLLYPDNADHLEAIQIIKNLMIMLQFYIIKIIMKTESLKKLTIII